MSRVLYVHHEARLVGRLERDAAGELTFAYAAGWLEAPERFPISVNLPLTTQRFGAPQTRFFSNLLPEGDSRRWLCERLGISPSNDFELLVAIGGECAGAFVLSQEESLEGDKTEDYRPLSRRDLETLAKSQVLPSLDGQKNLRLSLAGAQDKLPVRLEGGDILLPVGVSPSTHILKFSNLRYRHLPANEVLTMMVAEELGLGVAEVDWRELRSEGMCVVTRYDRYRREDGRIARRHQEDGCQLLTVSPSHKYEKEGGPSFSQIFAQVQTHSVLPLVDARRMVDWLAFNVLAMNADGHAKNVSMLYGAEGARLAPFYDLVCTRIYGNLSRELAMRVGGETDPTLVRRQHWEKLALEVGLGSRFVSERVRELAERLPDAVTAGATEFRSRFGEKPPLQLILPKVRRQAKRVRQLLES